MSPRRRSGALARLVFLAAQEQFDKTHGVEGFRIRVVGNPVSRLISLRLSNLLGDRFCCGRSSGQRSADSERPQRRTDPRTMRIEFVASQSLGPRSRWESSSLLQSPSF